MGLILVIWEDESKWHEIKEEVQLGGHYYTGQDTMDQDRGSWCRWVEWKQNKLKVQSL